MDINLELHIYGSFWDFYFDFCVKGLRHEPHFNEKLNINILVKFVMTIWDFPHNTFIQEY